MKSKTKMKTSREKSLPNQIRRYRLERGLRLRDVAGLTGQSCVAHISHWEKGRKLPSLENSLRLALAIQCPIEILFIDLFNQIKKSPEVSEWEKISAGNGLSKILGQAGGKLPTRGEISLLENVFGKEFIKINCFNLSIEIITF